MPSYQAFGLRLECDLELPDLTQAVGGDGPLWRLETRRTDPPDLAWQQIGVDTVYGAVRVRAFGGRDVLRLAFDDTGTFDVRRANRTIAWYPGPEASNVAVRADLLGRVIAVAAHADGALALHASAVSMGGAAVAFLGLKHAGKSTLALALVRRGARLVADDTLVVRLGDGHSATVVPGVQRVRLWGDSARALDVPVASHTGAKPTIDALSPDVLECDEVPLAACYILGAAAATTGDVAVARARLSPVQAALAGVRFSKLGALMGGGEAGAVLDRAARLAGAAAFFDAAVPRDLARLDAVAARLIDWHASPAVPNAGTGPR